MKESNELFELCEQVYKATGWEQSPNISQLYEYWDNYDELCVISIEDADDALVPAYTSDYLLEKLPGLIGITSVHMDDVHTKVRKLRPGESPSGATYQSNVKGLLIGAGGDTPLEALLRLTLKLHEKEIL